MDSVGDKRGRDDVDDKPNKTVVITQPTVELTDEQVSDYYRQCLSSKGFNVPEYGGSLPGGVGRYKIVTEEREQFVTDLAKRCLQFYNDQKNASFEFDKLVKVNRQVVAGFMFYITFTARAGDNASETFYGKVWQKISNVMVVEFCEMALKQESGTSQEADTSQEAGTSPEAGTSSEAGTSQEADTSQAIVVE